MKFSNKLNIRAIAIVIVVMSSLTACSSIERIRSESLFEQYCNEEGRVGQFIYERVALGEEFFRPIPADGIELRRIDSIYYIYIDGEKLLIDENRFNKGYTLSFWKKTMLSPTGPIYSLETTIVRKSDGKLLSKAVSLSNMLDKTSKHFPVVGIYCPTEVDIKGYSLSIINHRNLIEKTFSSKII